MNTVKELYGPEASGERIRGIARSARGSVISCEGTHTEGARPAIAGVLPAMNWKKVRLIEYKAQLKVVLLSLLLAFSTARAWGQCAGKVSTPAAAADCAARETPHEGTAVLDPAHAYTLAELIDVAEQHNPSTRMVWERAKEKAGELGLAKSAYYPDLDGLAVFGDERLINPFPKPLAPRGYVMVEVPVVRPEVTLQYLIFDFGKREANVDSAKEQKLASGADVIQVNQALAFRVASAYYPDFQRRFGCGPTTTKRLPLPTPPAARSNPRNSHCGDSLALPHIPAGNGLLRPRWGNRQAARPARGMPEILR